MTLILSAIWGPWAFHASDRLVGIAPTSQNPGGGWDPNSNKTIVVLGADCWLVLGYTGLAYLDDKPTDEYLAECITGIEDLSGRPAFFGWHPGPGFHYREIRNRIESGLERAYAKLPRRTREGYRTAVLASGLQSARRSTMRRVMFKVSALGDSTSAVEMVPRRLPIPGIHLAGVGQCAHDLLYKLSDDLNGYRDDVHQGSCGDPDPIVFRDMMLQAVRETAAIVPDAVGKHVVGVILDPQQNKISSVFSPAGPDGEPPVGRELSDVFSHLPKIPTPWVLKPGISHAPSVGNAGGWVNVESGLTFEYAGFDSSDGGPGGGYFGSQPRKRPPS